MGTVVQEHLECPRYAIPDLHNLEYSLQGYHSHLPTGTDDAKSCTSRHTRGLVAAKQGHGSNSMNRLPSHWLLAVCSHVMPPPGQLVRPSLLVNTLTEPTLFSAFLRPKGYFDIDGSLVPCWAHQQHLAELLIMQTLSAQTVDWQPVWSHWL